MAKQIYIVAEPGSAYEKAAWKPGCGCTIRQATRYTPDVICRGHAHDMNEPGELVHVGLVRDVSRFEQLYQAALEEPYPDERFEEDEI